MTASVRVIDFIVDVRRGIRVEPDGSPDTQKMRMVVGDDIQWNFNTVTVDPSTQSSTPYGFDGATIFRVVGKKYKDFGGVELITAEPTTFNVAEHRNDVDVATGKLSTRFRLNKAALLDAIGNSDPTIKVVIDIECISPAGEVSTLLQITDELLNHAARNPTNLDGYPIEYMTLDDLRAEIRKLTHPDGGHYQLDGGDLKLLDTTTEEFIALALDDHALTPLEDA